MVTSCAAIFAALLAWWFARSLLSQSFNLKQSYNTPRLDFFPPTLPFLSVGHLYLHRSFTPLFSYISIDTIISSWADGGFVCVLLGSGVVASLRRRPTTRGGMWTHSSSRSFRHLSLLVGTWRNCRAAPRSYVQC